MNWISIDELRLINKFNDKAENLKWYGREGVAKTKIWDNDFFRYKGREFIGDKKVIYYEAKDMRTE